MLLLCSKVSQRQAARILRIDPKTVARKLIYFGKIGREHLASLGARNLLHVQFDEMQTSEHSKCKQVSIPMAVDVASRKILAFAVCPMPTGHPLTEIALRRYGPRKDGRPEAIAEVLHKIRPMLRWNGFITTDSAQRYPAPIAAILRGTTHQTILSRRAHTMGHGELKRIGFDPLFSFNHTAAMVRDGIGRLVRKTWCTTKKLQRLEDHIAMFAYYRNTERTPDFA